MDLVKLVLITLGYLVCSKISFLTSFSGNPAGPTPIWLPTGFTIAMVLKYGRNIWPAILLGAVVSDSTLKPGLVTGLMLVMANMAEPLIAEYLLRRYTRFTVNLVRIRDVTSLVAAGLVSTAVSATIGVSGLYLFGPKAVIGFPLIWWHWWVANMLSCLIITPLILSWDSLPNINQRGRRLVEIALGSLLGAGVTWYVFFSPQIGNHLPFIYWFYPVLMWLAFRLGMRGTTAGVFLFSVATIYDTIAGRGPFIAMDPLDSLDYLQTFLGITAVTGISLAAAVEELHTALMLRDEFLSIASHEFRTPLSSLMTQIELINRLITRNTFGEVPREKQLRLVSISKTQIQRLDRLVGDLLEVSRIRGGKALISREELDLSELVDQTLERYQEQLSIARCEVRLNLKRPLRGNWDSMRTEEVIINLLTNAMKYGAGKPIQVVTRVENGTASIEVRDHGIGISKQDQERIFGRFERAASLKSYGGLGLGLYISKMFAEAQGGTIQVESEPGHGATFIVKLPIRKGKAA